MEIKIRAFEDSDTDILMARFEGLKLFDRGRAYLEWSISFRPEQRIFLLACLDNAIIGYYNATMSWLKVDDKIINAYYGGILIHPDHRKKRYSFLTMNRLVKRLRDEIINKQGVFYGFPNPRLGAYSNRVNETRPIKPIPRYICVLRAACVFRQILKPKKIADALGEQCQPLWRWRLLRTKHRAKGVMVKEIHFFDKRFNRLWEKASKTHKIISMRDTEYLNWRYLKEPGRRFLIFAAERNNELQGYVILKPFDSKNQGPGQIIDLFDVKDKRVTKALLLQAIEYFDAQGADKIEFFVSDDYYERMLRSLGFVKRKTRSGVVDRLVATCRSKSIDPDYFYDAKHWFITTADMLLS